MSDSQSDLSVDNSERKPGFEIGLSDAGDNVYLELLGYKQEFKRDFSLLGLYALCSSELSVLVGVSGTIWYTMGYCGWVGMTWGWLIGAILGQPQAYALAELSSAYPTSGGLYYWAYMTAAPKYKKLSSYIVAWSMFISTPLACCSTTYSAAQMLMVTIQVAFPDYVPTVWHIYLVYVGLMTLTFLTNCLPTRRLSTVNICASVFGIIILLVTTITLPAKASHLNSGEKIFTEVYNQIGWPTPWSFCMSFIAPAWAISGYDVAAHVAEETHNAARNVPRAMVWSTWTAGALGFAYLVSLALCATDIDALMANPLGQPIGTLITDILGQKAGIALLSLNIIAQFGCSVAFFVAASRIFFAYSRDKALPYSDWISKLDKHTYTPNNASFVVYVLSFVVGVVSVISDTAFEATFSGCILAGQIAYVLPVLGRCLYEDNPEYIAGPYTLGKLSKVLRWTSVVWNSFIICLVAFPTEPNPTTTTMNWAVVIYIPLQIFAFVYWYFWGHKTFVGPRRNVARHTTPDSQPQSSEKTLTQPLQ